MPGLADHPDTEGQNASLPQGAATQMSQLQRESGMLAHSPGQRPGSQPPLPGAGLPAGQPPSQAPTGTPPDPAAIVNGGSVDMGKVFQPQRTAPVLGWREELTALGNHPAAGPWLRYMAKLASQQHRG